MKATNLNILIINDGNLQDEIKDALEALTGEIRYTSRVVMNYRQGVEAARNILPQIIFFEIERDLEKTRKFVQEIKTVSGKSIVVGTFRPFPGESTLAGMFVLEGMRAGIKDFLRRPISSYDLKQLLDRVLDESVDKPAKSGKIITVLSNKGGVGKSTIAVNLACGLAHRYPGEVLLLDTSIQLGAISAMLDMQPTTSLADVIREKNRLDTILLRRMALHHESGLHLIPAPRDAAETAEINDEALSRILNVARSSYRYVVIDTFPVVDGLVVAALDFSDMIYVIVEGVVPTVLGCAQLIGLLNQLKYTVSKQRIVLNRHSTFAGNLTPDLVAERLDREVNYIVPYTRESLIAMNIGRPLIVEHRNSLPLKQWTHRLIDRLVAARIKIPWFMKINNELQFVYEIERMVDEIDHDYRQDLSVNFKDKVPNQETLTPISEEKIENDKR